MVKGAQASLTEGAIGGLVNLRSASPFDQRGQHGLVRLEADRNLMSELNGSKLSAAYSNTFDNNVGVLFGLPSLLLGVGVLAWCWGPRDLDRDVEAIIDADDAAARQAAVRNLPTAGGSLREDVPSLVEATLLNALRRWFAVLLWFLLLGPVGALGYRLLALMAESPMRARVPVEPLALAQRLLGWIEWPVAQLMAFSMALVGNFDTACKAWRQAHGERLAGGIGFLGVVARASVNAELREDAHDYTEAGLLPVWQRLPDLRDAMSLVWRMLLLWLAILALLVIAGWVT